MQPFQIDINNLIEELNKAKEYSYDRWPYHFEIRSYSLVCKCKYCNKSYQITKFADQNIIYHIICEDCLFDEIYKIMPITEEELNNGIS